MAVPYTFASATGSIPLSQLDSNFSTPITIGNTTVTLGSSITTIYNLTLGNVIITSVGSTFPNNYLANANVILGTTTVPLGNTATTLDGLTLANVTVSSGNVTLTKVTVTTANVTTANIGTAVITTANVTTANVTTANVTTANVTTANIATLAGTNATFSGYPNMPNTFGFKNRIINGAMVIDQRNAGTEVNPAVTNTYYLDRWQAASSAASKFKIGQNAGAVTPPTGYINYLGCTSLSAYSVGAAETFNVQQRIEGLNVADLAWGTASAATVTLSFWVYSSLTGTFGGSLRNGTSTRSYPFAYTISSANTWTQASVTIAGDTTGTWLTTNGSGINVVLSLGAGATFSNTAGVWAAANYASSTGAVSVVGTSGATFYITGVQLEKGSTATSFDYRPYGTELALCQRYYYKNAGDGTGNDMLGVYWCISTTRGDALTVFPVTMRTSPTALEQTGTAADYTMFYAATTAACSAVPTFVTANTQGARTNGTVASGLTVGQGSAIGSTANTAYFAWSAEL
jgi:hypothetical protein